MAVRLPVILSQPARREASTTELVENIVAAALMTPGLDANLIGDISTIESGSTDHVCLLGHGRDLVLASFLELAEARAAWQRLGQSGQFVDLSQDEADIRASLRGATAVRKVFYYQLALGQPVERLLDQCRKLLAAQQLSLVSIQWRPGGSDGAVGSVNALQSPSAKVPAPALALLPLAGASAGPQSTGRQEVSEPAEQSRSHVTRGAPAEPDEGEEWNALDKLVDELGAMDL